MNELAERLALLAAQGQTITYGALARDLDCRIGVLTDALEAMMEQDAAAGQPLRAVLCKGRLSEDMPAPGFFAKAAELGLDIRDPQRLVTEHRARLCKA